jgi:hypothetical protein
VRLALLYALPAGGERPVPVGEGEGARPTPIGEPA